MRVVENKLDLQCPILPTMVFATYVQLLIQSFIQQAFVEHLLCAIFCERTKKMLFFPHKLWREWYQNGHQRAVSAFICVCAQCWQPGHSTQERLCRRAEAWSFKMLGQFSWWCKGRSSAQEFENTDVQVKSELQDCCPLQCQEGMVV